MDNVASKQLLDAARKKDVKEIKQLLSSGACPNIKDEKKNTPLHLLLYGGNTNIEDTELLEATDALINSGAILDYLNEDEYCPLAVAAFCNKYAAAEMLLKAGACVSIRNHTQFVCMEPSMTKLLSQWGCIYHEADLTHEQMDHPRSSTFQFMINDRCLRYNKANYRMTYKSGRSAKIQYACTPLHVAARLHRHDQIKELLYLESNPNTQDSDGVSPLKEIIRYERDWNETTFDLLVAGGANLNVLDQSTPCLTWAIEQKMEILVRKLIEAGANVNICTDQNRFTTPLHVAVKMGDITTARLLVEAGANVDAMDGNGHTPLHSACRAITSAMTELLINAGADINVQDKWGDTVYTQCLRFRNVDALKKLIQSGGHKCDATFEGHVFKAAHFDDTDLLEVLASSGGNFDFKDKNGRTPLHIAVLKGNLKAVEILINANADVDTQDKWEITPVEDAQTRQNTNIINLVMDTTVSKSKTAKTDT